MQILTADEIEKELNNLKGWAYNENRIWKQFEFENFKEAISFIIRIGFEAESLNHHPNILNIYNKVTISLQTHDAGNKVTWNDINLAKTIESLY